MSLNTQPPNKKATALRRWIYTLVSVGVTVGVFTYLFKYVSFAEIVQLVRNADRNALAGFLCLSLANCCVRTWRYQLLLSLSGYQPGRVALFLTVLVRNLFSDLLPARLGSLIYIFIVNTRLGVPIGPATSSFAVVFLFDILAIVPMILAAVALTTMVAQIPVVPLLIMAMTLLTIVALMIHYLPQLCQLGIKIIGWIKLIPSRAARVLIESLESTRMEIIKARAAGLYLPMLVLSVLVRLTKYAALIFFLYALLHPLGYQWTDIKIPAAFLGICSSELAASLPISGIAAFGAYEGAWAFTFELLGYPGHIAKLTAISHHLFTQVYGYLLGASAFLLLLLPQFKRQDTLPAVAYQRDSHAVFFLKVAVAALLLWLALLGVSLLPLDNSAAHGNSSFLHKSATMEAALEIPSAPFSANGIPV